MRQSRSFAVRWCERCCTHTRTVPQLYSVLHTSSGHVSWLAASNLRRHERTCHRGGQHCEKSPRSGAGLGTVAASPSGSAWTPVQGTAGGSIVATLGASSVVAAGRQRGAHVQYPCQTSTAPAMAEVRAARRKPLAGCVLGVQRGSQPACLSLLGRVANLLVFYYVSAVS